MKKLSLYLAIIVTSIATAMPAQAGFRIGPRLGVSVNSIHFSKETFATDNRSGFTGGLQAEITLPLGFAVDGSVLYVHRTVTVDDYEKGLNYIDVPLNLKWNLNLPAISSIISPYIFTGPDFSFLANKKGVQEAWESKKVDVSWNIGVGLQLFKHLQVGASYGIGMTKFGEYMHINTNKIEGKNNCWTITAAWLF